MEIERKFLIEFIPFDLSAYKCLHLEQGYINTSPTVRIRKEDDEYYLTYKSSGLLSREEYNLPLDEKSYYHMRDKVDGHLITKLRYLIPFGKYTIELDVFEAPFAPLVYAEVEFETEDEAISFTPPEWFGQDVTYDKSYTNAALSSKEL